MTNVLPRRYLDEPHPFTFSSEEMLFKLNRMFAFKNHRQFFSNHTTYFLRNDHDVSGDDAHPESPFMISW